MKYNSLETLIADASFIRWVKGESSPEQAALWEAWLREDPDHYALKEEARELIATFDDAYNVPDPLKELNKLEGTIDRYKKQQHKIGDHSSKSFFQTYRSAIAAGILFLLTALAGYFAYQNNLWQIQSNNRHTAHTAQQYTTGYGEKATFKLSDGSRIILNANSSLKFSSNIEKGLNTEVWLEGEAYFDIAHLTGEQQRTFTVHTRAGSIQVLGTKFAVKTFSNKTRAVLEEGKIRIQVKGRPQKPLVQHILKPGQMARFTSGDHNVVITEVDVRIYTSWIEDKFVFSNTPMKDVARRIEDTFGIEVVIGKKYIHQHLTGSIKSTNLQVLAEALAEILHTSIKREGQRLLIGKVKYRDE